MHILIATLALVGIAAVSNAGPIGRPLDPSLAEGYPFELYPIPPRENRNLSNYVAVGFNVVSDAEMYRYIILKYVNDIKVSGKIPNNAEATVDELLSNWENMVERAYSFNYEPFASTMLIVIAVLVHAGLVAVTQALPVPEHKFTPKYKHFYDAFPADVNPFEIPPSGNRSLQNFKALSGFTTLDISMKAEHLIEFLNSSKVDERVSDNAEATVIELFHNLTKRVEEAYSFLYETIDQLYSEVELVHYTSLMARKLIGTDEDNRKRVEELLEQAEIEVFDFLGSQDAHVKSTFMKDSQIDKLLKEFTTLRDHVAQLLELNIIDTSEVTESQKRILVASVFWGQTGELPSPSQLDQMVEEINGS
uniref:DUF148 domain-containing protein n=1 Tax=Panagrellus redivivus TaxID=6233 RepID=A0A7E4W2S0_PANRE